MVSQDVIHRRASVRSVPIRRGLELLFVAGVGLALWFALIMQPPTIRFAALPFRSDHIMHATTFLALTFLGAWLWAPVVLFAGIMIAAGGLLELMQGPVGREMSIGDWFASSAGVVIGALAFVATLAMIASFRRMRS
jgi:VanZ family protein